MMIIVLLLAVLCIVFPLLPAGLFGSAPDGTPLPFSKTPLALPLMAIGMLLPFAFFFIFAGPEAMKNRK